MDIVDLREFYGSRLGHTTRRFVANRLKPRLGSTAGTTIVGLGYAIPYMEDCLQDAQRCVALMPARQGVIHWPHDKQVLSALVEESEIPLLESVADIALVVHALELTDSPEDMLKEVWRVLAPQGRMIIIVPNRRGLWARFDTSPFGFGQPFSKPQLANLLKECQFSAVSWSQALFMPPSHRSFLQSSAAMAERVGNRLLPGLAGVLIVEAVKQVYAISGGKRVRRLAARFRPALAPAPAQGSGMNLHERVGFSVRRPYEDARLSGSLA